jgi:hypothetical protein
VNEKKEDLADWWKNQGGLGLWNDDAKIYGAKLESERYRAWRIYSAMGFAGFIIGKDIKQKTPNQAPETTICTVTDRAPSGTLRASADRVSP